MSKRSSVTEADLLRLLGERFKAPEYAFLPHVRNGTGYQRRQVRTADAIAMSLYPSRGLDLHGFEVKVDRRDWLRELHAPEKADEIGKFCSYWWIVVADKALVSDGELPMAWGLLAAEEGKLVQVKAPVALPEPKQVDRLLLAAILRRTVECHGPAAEVAAAVSTARAEAKAEAEEHLKWRKEEAVLELEALQKRVGEFEKASGVSLKDAWRLDRIGEAVRVVMQGGELDARQRLGRLREEAQRVVTRVDEVLGQAAEAPVVRSGE